MKLLARGTTLLFAAAGFVIGPASLAAADSSAGSPAQPLGWESPAIFVQTNNPAGNQVTVYAQEPNGQLSQQQVVSSGGLGAASSGAANLASEGSLTYDPEHNLLFAVNAGSDTISVLSADGPYVHLDQVLSSGGEFPNSIAVHGNLVYVVNAGGTGSVSGFYIIGRYVVPIPGSTRSLGLPDSGNPPAFHDDPGQVAFSSDGSSLVVSTKEGTNSIDVFQVGPLGFLSPTPTSNADDSNAPFAFASTPSGQLVVAELTDASLHTFAFGAGGTLTSLSASVPDGGVATCWVVAADGFYFVANAGSKDLSTYAIAPDGTPSVVQAVAGTTANGATDPVVSANGKYLYDENGTAVAEFQINPDGSLTPIGSVTGLGANTEGIAAD